VWKKSTGSYTRSNSGENNQKKNGKDQRKKNPKGTIRRGNPKNSRRRNNYQGKQSNFHLHETENKKYFIWFISFFWKVFYKRASFKINFGKIVAFK
jgi:hypothetical protein